MHTPGTNKMATAPMNKLLLTLSLPIMFSMLIQALYNIVDSIFIARFSEQALSAVALTFPLQTLIIAISIGTCIGVNACLGRALGAQDMARARAIAQHGALLAALSYLPFLIIGACLSRQYFAIQTADAEIIAAGMDYMSICLLFSLPLFGQQLFEKLLQATGRSVLSMVSQLVGAVINVMLDPILIFGWLGCPALGAKGAAIATVIGQLAAFMLAMAFHQRYNRGLRLSPAGFRIDAAIIKQIYRIGLPAIVLQAIGSVTNFAINGILLTFSATAAAVFGIYFKLQNFVFMPIYGLSSGMLPIMSYNLGARNRQRVLAALRWAMIYMALIMLAGTALFQLLPEQLLNLFDASANLLTLGLTALRVISLSFIFEGFCVISQTGFQALGRGLASLISSLSRQVVVLLPLAYALSLSGSISRVWLAFPITGALGAVVCLLLWRDVHKKNLQRNN